MDFLFSKSLDNFQFYMFYFDTFPEKYLQQTPVGQIVGGLQLLQIFMGKVRVPGLNFRLSNLDWDRLSTFSTFQIQCPTSGGNTKITCNVFKAAGSNMRF